VPDFYSGSLFFAMDKNTTTMYVRKMKTAPPPRVNISNHHLKIEPHCTWGPRAIPDTELIFIHSGTFLLKLENKTFKALKNEILVIFPGEHHTLQCLGKPASISCIHCDLPDNQTLARIIRTGGSEVADGFRRCADAFLNPVPWRDELLHAILLELWIRIRASGTLTEIAVPSERVQKMVDYIREHLADPVTRTTLAKKFHTSPQHINHLFKTELATTPTELLHRERAKRAFILIQNENSSIKEAADRTGFCDPYHFSKVFKKVYGITPGTINRFFKSQ